MALTEGLKRGLAFGTAGVILLVLIAGAIIVFKLYAGLDRIPIPLFETVKGGHESSDAVLRDRHGEVLDGLRVDLQGRRLDWVALKDISPAMVRAVVKNEDKRFFSHHGVDWRAFGAALSANLRGGTLRGASTITMQVVPLVGEGIGARKSKRRTIGEKWVQVRAALALEKKWPKEKILEAYLNLISFRGELQGVACASRGLFDKDPSGLTDGESYLLTALIAAPNGSIAGLTRRACRLAAADAEATLCRDIRTLAEEKLNGAYRINPRASLAPHVARMLLGKGRKEASCSLDRGLQVFVTEALGNQTRLLKDRHVFDGAAIAVENETGEILAYVGNSGTSPESVYIDGIRARRQAGSTLKPFLYELAIEEKLLTAASILDDAPLHVSTPTGLYVPHNYDKDFKGPVTVRTALSASMNIPAVKTLLLVGVAPFVDRLRGLGFGGLTESPDFYGYSLALGSADVTLLELVNAYRTLANGGRFSELKLETGKAKSPGKRVMDERGTFIISHILSDREARSATFGFESPLATRFFTAVKTGTSKDMRDNWCIGYSEKYTVGVWIGNFSGEPMRNVSGVTGAAPVWSEIMDYLHRSRSSKGPKPAPGVLRVPTSFEAGIEPGRDEWFMEGTAPNGVVKRDLVHGKARITYPVDETVITLDGEIPEALQKVPFRFQPVQREYGWVLNGDRLDSSASPFLWSPRRGKFVLSITDADGRIVDSIRFAVR